jgi:hypothetical protein
MAIGGFGAGVADNSTKTAIAISSEMIQIIIQVRYASVQKTS